MIFLYLLILLLTLYGSKFGAKDSDSLSLSQSTMVKGIFVLLVFISHSSTYIEDLIPAFKASMVSFLYIRHWLGQLIVVPFLFYSGYGIRLSISKKGDRYLHAMPKNRILKTYVHTVLIVALFFLLQLALGERYTPKQIFLSFLLWDSFGNSNWYMFAILLLYLATFISFRLFSDERKATAFCCFLTLLYSVVLWRMKESWWYNTVLVYWFGLIYPDIRTKVEAATNGTDGSRRFIICVLVFLLAFLTLWNTGNSFIDGLLENLRSISLMLLIVTILQNLVIGNRVLHWCGSHVFEIYLLQRLPMILFTKLGLAYFSIVIWYLACIAVTVVLTLICEKTLKEIDQKMFA